jgi:SAM-dependent methyltransferase
VRETLVNLLPARIERRRRKVSARFLSGRGVEIGALHSPLWVSSRAQVTYVDRLAVEDLRRHYPELDGSELCRVDVIDDGERLLQFADASLDFVIANHMLEHCENPLGAMRNHLARVRPGGILYYAVPDKRFTFDVDRPLTDFEHLVRDDQEGPAWSRWGHFLEWSRLVDKAGDDSAAEAHARELMEKGYSIHFHVWDDERFRAILRAAHGYLGRGFRVEWLEQNDGELIAVLRKGEDPSPEDPLRGAGPPPSPLRVLLRRLRGRLGQA